MATLNFLKFDGIDGESTSRDHKGEIELLSWHWGLTASRPAGGGGGAGKAVPGEFHFVHHYDKASPLLAKAAAAGRRTASVTLSARKSGEGQKDFFQIVLKDVSVMSVMASDGGEGAREEVGLAYGSIDFSYAPPTPRGSLGTPVLFGWNIRTGKVT